MSRHEISRMSQTTNLDSRRPIRVGVNAALARIGRTTGVGRIWSIGIDRLGHSASIILDPGNYTVEPRPDVWLADGHSGAIAVSEPVVALAFEARWVEPRLAADLNPAFLSWVAPSTAQGVRRATRVLTISFASARNIAQLGVGADRIDVVPPGVDLTVFQPGLSGGRELVTARAGDDRPYIICVASLFRGKNLVLLRRAVARLSSRGFPHRMVLVTQDTGVDRLGANEVLAELMTGEGSPPIIFQNLPEEQLAALIAGATVFCLPSTFEGFGLPALEALACGVPVLVSDGGALPEVVADAGLIVEPAPEAIEQALASVIEGHSLAQNLAAKGRARAEMFTWEKMIDGWLLSLARAAQG